MEASSQSLADWPVGQKGILRALELPEAQQHRLMELGLLPGTEIELVRRAPLGEPYEILVRGSHLSLRRTEAQALSMEALPS